MAVIQRARVDDTAENPRAVVGANRPPLDEEARAAFDEALDQKEGFRDRVKQLLGASDRAVATTEEEAGRCGELVKQIRAAAKFIADTHTAVKAPYLLAGRAIDAAKNDLTGPLEVAKAKVEGRQTQFLREEEAKRQAEIRRQREAEEARRRAEWEAEQARIAEQAPVDEPAPVMEAAPPPPPPVAEPERQIIRGDYGAAVSGTKAWFHQIEDFEIAFMAVSNNEKVREAIDKAISNMVRGGVREIAGVRIWSDIKASNR